MDEKVNEEEAKAEPINTDIDIIEDFEAALARLKEIEKIVIDENIPLEDCLDLLDESVALADICVKKVNSGLDEKAEATTIIEPEQHENESVVGN